jgi:very-short-patch-repair endonuclease
MSSATRTKRVTSVTSSVARARLYVVVDYSWLEEIAAQHHGTLSLTELTSKGLARHDIARLVKKGILARMLPSVYRAEGSPETMGQRLWAAHKWAGSDVLLSHRTGLHLHGLPRPAFGRIEMTTMKKLRSPSPWLELHYTKRDPLIEGVMVKGLPVTSLGRTLLDSASVITSARLEIAVDHSLRAKSITVPELWAVLLSQSGRGCRGARALRRLLEERDDGRARSHSELEILMNSLLRSSQLVPYERQFVVATRVGIPAQIDFAWPAARLGVEVDGYWPHAGRRQWQNDMQRQNALAEVGWLLLRFSWYDVTRRPDYVLETIRTTLHARLSSALRCT